MGTSEVRMLGIEVTPITIHNLNDAIARCISGKRFCVIGHHNLHSVYLYHRDIKMRRFYEKCDFAFIDGMPLVLWGKLLGYPLSRTERVTYVDWTPHLMGKAAEEGWKVFYLGGRPGVAERAAERLRLQYPNLAIRTRHGYFQPEENEDVLKEVAQFGTQILLVGMGMPRQEHWILDNWDRLSANVVLTAGAAFDYVAGAIPTPPRWMGQIGLEWLYRLLSEPRRLWRRYLVEPFFLVPYAFRDLIAKR